MFDAPAFVHPDAHLGIPSIQINANRMVPIRLLENVENSGGPHLYQVKLMRCPEPETQGTEANG